MSRRMKSTPTPTAMMSMSNVSVQRKNTQSHVWQMTAWRELWGIPCQKDQKPYCQQECCDWRRPACCLPDRWQACAVAGRPPESRWWWSLGPAARCWARLCRRAWIGLCLVGWSQRCTRTSWSSLPPPRGRRNWLEHQVHLETQKRKQCEGLNVCDIVFYEASAFRWTYTTHSEGQDLICCVLLCYWQYSTVHSGVWRHSAAQILVLCAVGLHCHRTTRSCSPQGERHRSRSSAQIHLPSPSAGTQPPRSPEHLHPARKCTSIYLPFLKAQRLVNPFHYFYLNIHDLNYRFHSSWNISCKAQILDLYFHCCSSQAMHMVTQ